MTSLFSIFDKFNVVNKHFEESEDIRAYKRIVAEHGPSQSLFDFINRDKSIGAAIGLEGFDSFSLQTKNEILLSSLNEETSEQLAMEGFVEVCVKLRHWLLAGGFIIPPLWVGAIIGYVKNSEKVQVIKYQEYTALIKDVTEAITLSDDFVKGIPSGTDEDDWEKFRNKVSEKEFDGDYEKSADLAPIDKSGWTSSNFKTEAERLKSMSEKLDGIKKSYAQKISTIEKFVATNESGDKASTAKLMASSNKVVADTIRKANFLANTAKNLLASVSKGFEFKDK